MLKYYNFPNLFNFSAQKNPRLRFREDKYKYYSKMIYVPLFLNLVLNRRMAHV